MNPIVTPWIAEVVILSVRSVRRDKRPPLPSEFAATFVIFGGASLIAGKFQQPAVLFSWGIVIASLFNLFDIDGRLRMQGQAFSYTSKGPQPLTGRSEGGRPINPTYPGEAPGWHPPMAPGYVPNL